MTPALKAMTIAMAAEAKRQDAEEDARLEAQPWLAAETVPPEYAYDWAKVARAGLEAIKVAGDGIVAAMRQTVPVDGHEWEFCDEDAQAHWAALLDAILDAE